MVCFVYKHACCSFSQHAALLLTVAFALARVCSLCVACVKSGWIGASHTRLSTHPCLFVFLWRMFLAAERHACLFVLNHGEAGRALALLLAGDTVQGCQTVSCCVLCRTVLCAVCCCWRAAVVRECYTTGSVAGVLALELCCTNPPSHCVGVFVVCL